MPENAEQTHLIEAAPADAGSRLDTVLATRIPTLSRTRVKALIREGRASIGGRTIAEPDFRVKPGQAIRLVVPESAPAAPEAQAIDLSILYEDDDIIVLDKPAGLVVHPAPGNPDRTLVNALLAHCGDRLAGIGGVRRPGIVHRLDKDTSGIMVVAKTDRAYAGLQVQFAKRTIERQYLALVWGVPRPHEGEIRGAIGRHPRHRKKMAVLRRGGKPALTRYQVVETYGSGLASLVLCRLGSGRTHQIRVHLADRGHPVLGDPLYGSIPRRAPEALKTRLAGLKRQALHAESLGLTHPTTGKSLTFHTELPFNLKALVDFLKSV
ncbi:MAG: RluA family pseudouridine synthase [Alphaproteobacteria bacterium]